ncbi:T9SS type A sorting domain-containing protein [Saccharicrinis aurantiacus]|uniref:T9SS type A sorting domain-containing protein n=1 Tax=Saccharicrinis aurantiacus TaxID=1849719 RepID=UPI0024904EAE|nr:T9SS type A sorting domain-containing protein [Saccharicrinis aurantiacus]
MKKIILCLAMALIAIPILSASGWGYNNHRIAVSADGNNQPDPDTWGGSVSPNAPAADVGNTFTYNSAWQRGDEDDWSATPAALAMLANAGLEGNLVHYSYNNFIGSPAHTTARNIMKEGVEGALLRWTDFDASVFYDVSADNTAAINHLAEQIKISTASDPLYFVSMGPSEFLYRALEKVKADGNESSISHLYILSHSNYNDNHIRRVDHRRVEHILNDFPVTEGVNFKRIKDQNQSSNLNNGWSSSKVNGSKTWYPYNFLRDHFDPDCNFLWDMLNVDASLSKPDISDAGMIWFLLYNDQDGNPSKLKTQFIDGIKAGSTPEPDGYCPALDSYETDGLLVFEAERIELKGDWKLGTDDANASGGKYIYYDGPNNYQAQNPANTLSYSFDINTPGTYTFKWFVRQNEEERGKVEGQQGTDLSNDAWIKFSDGIGYFGEDQVTDFIKFYGRSDPGFWLHGVGEYNHSHKWVNVKIPAAGTYTMEIAGRSHGYQIDKIVMAKGLSNWGSYTEKTEAQAHKYWSETGTPDPDCVRPVRGCETILAKDFTNLNVDDYDPATVEWRKSVTWDGGAKELIKCNGTNGINRPIAAEVAYSGTPQGNATFKVHAMQEPDGECTYEVFVNGIKVGEKQISSSYDATHDIEDEGLRNAIEILEIETQATIITGDIIRVTSNQVTNGKVPEENTTATARGRWYALEVCVGDGPIQDRYLISSSKVKAVVNTTEADNKNITIGITYTASAICDLAYAIKSMDDSEEFAFGRVNGIEAGTHSTDLELNLKTALVLNTEYKIVRWFMPSGGTFNDQFEPTPTDINWTYGASAGPPTIVFNGTEPNEWGYIDAGSAAAGSSLEITGTGYTAGDVVTGTLTPWTGWSNAGATVYGTYEATADALGNISGSLIINATTPIGSKLDTGSGTGYMIQLRGTSGGNVITFKHTKNFTNIKLGITEAIATAIKPIIDNELNVFPNPCNNWVNYENNGEIESVGLYNINGQILLSEKANNGLNKLSLEEYDKGIFVLKFKFVDQSQRIVKIIKN